MLLATFHVKTDEYDVKEAFQKAQYHADYEVMPALKENPENWSLNLTMTVFVKRDSTEYFLYQFTLHKGEV